MSDSRHCPSSWLCCLQQWISLIFKNLLQNVLNKDLLLTGRCLVERRQTEDTCTVLIAANISLLIRAKLNYNSFHSHRDNQQTEFTISKTGALYHEKSWQQRIKYKYRVSQQYQTHCILPALSQLTTGLREHSHRKLLSAYLKTLKYFTTELRHWSRVTCVFINIFNSQKYLS